MAKVEEVEGTASRREKEPPPQPRPSTTATRGGVATGDGLGWRRAAVARVDSITVVPGNVFAERSSVQGEAKGLLEGKPAAATRQRAAKVRLPMMARQTVAMEVKA